MSDSRLLRERGSTLVELIVTVAIIGVAVTALVGGMTTAIVVSDAHRKHASGDTVARSAAEHLKSTGVAYQTCAGPGSYSMPSGSAVAAVEFWDGNTPAGFTSSCATDRGLQRITVSVAGDERSGVERIVILKRRR